jgi:hypothetical protein
MPNNNIKKTQELIKHKVKQHTYSFLSFCKRTEDLMLVFCCTCNQPLTKRPPVLSTRTTLCTILYIIPSTICWQCWMAS